MNIESPKNELNFPMAFIKQSNTKKKFEKQAKLHFKSSTVYKFRQFNQGYRKCLRSQTFPPIHIKVSPKFYNTLVLHKFCINVDMEIFVIYKQEQIQVVGRRSHDPLPLKSSKFSKTGYFAP